MTHIDPLATGLPASPECERFVLACMLTDSEACANCLFSLGPDDFALERNRLIFVRARELHKRGDHVNRVSVAEELAKLKQLETISLTYLMELDEGMPVSANVDCWIRILQDKATLRKTAIKAQDMLNRCLLAREDSADIIADAEQFLRGLDRDKGSDGFASFAEILEAAGGLDGLVSKQDPGLPTPFAELNRLIIGLLPGDLVVVAARPGCGKSAMVQQTGVFLAERGHGVANFSLEMSEKRVLMRSLAERGEVSTNDIRRGNLNHVQRVSVQHAAHDLRELPYYTNTRAKTFAQIHAALRKLKARDSRMAVAIVDHLQLLGTTGRSENRNQEISKITRDMKIMAGELGIVVVLVSQLSRASETDRRAPEMRDLRDSGSIEQDADIILFLHRKDQPGAVDTGAPVPVDCLLAKQRDGVARIVIPMLFFGRHFRFVEASDRVEAA